MRQVVRLLNKQKLQEATKEYKRSMALKDGLRYLNTFGFSNWGQSDLRQKRQSYGAVEEAPGIFRRKREADDVAQPLRYLTGFGFTSLGIKRAKMMEASHPGLMYLMSFGFSNFGQKRTTSTPAEDLMKYLSSFGFARFGQKRALKDKDPRLEYLLGFGFWLWRLSKRQEKNGCKICKRGQFWVLTCGAEEKGSHRPGTSGWAHEHPKGVDIFQKLSESRFQRRTVLSVWGWSMETLLPIWFHCLSGKNRIDSFYACFLNFEPHKCNHFSFTVGLTFPLQGKRKLEKVNSSYFRIYPWFCISRNYDRPEKVSQTRRLIIFAFFLRYITQHILPELLSWRRWSSRTHWKFTKCMQAEFSWTYLSIYLFFSDFKLLQMYKLKVNTNLPFVS